MGAQRIDLADLIPASMWGQQVGYVPSAVSNLGNVGCIFNALHSFTRVNVATWIKCFANINTPFKKRKTNCFSLHSVQITTVACISQRILEMSVDTTTIVRFVWKVNVVTNIHAICWHGNVIYRSETFCP